MSLAGHLEGGMPPMFSRRVFLTAAGGALAAPAFSWGADEVPALLDHIILGCNDLDKGIAFFEERAGTRAVFGGVHPGRGTRNALLSLGTRRYLEIMAPDPKQQKIVSFPRIAKMTEPRLIGWALHTDDIAELAKKVAAAGFAIDGPSDGSRARPDGTLLRWKSFRLIDDAGGLLPFFIEWNRESVHPSVDAPAGCALVRFLARSAHPAGLKETYRRLGVDIAVEHGEDAPLYSRISSPKGEFVLTS